MHPIIKSDETDGKKYPETDRDFQELQEKGLSLIHI